MTGLGKDWPFELWQQIAIRRFHLQPNEFWAMPVQDWLTLLQGLKPAHFQRAELNKLIELYPDDGETNGHD